MLNPPTSEVHTFLARSTRRRLPAVIQAAAARAAGPRAFSAGERRAPRADSAGGAHARYAARGRESVPRHQQEQRDGTSAGSFLTSELRPRAQLVAQSAGVMSKWMKEGDS